MAFYCEYTTVAKLKAYKDTTSTLTASDGLFLDFIRQVSREIEDISNRLFYPRIELHYFDIPRRSYDLNFDHDLLEVTTLTNGDGIVIGPTNYKLYPLNDTPKRKLTLLPIQYAWQYSTNGTPFGAISLNGVWGYHDDYGNAWKDTGATLSAAISTTGATTATTQTGLVFAGDLLKIGTEFFYVSAVTIGSPNDTLTIARGVNGSTAATQLIDAVIYRWDPGTHIDMLTRRAALAYTKLRTNPIGETVTLDGQTFNTPKDVTKYIDATLRGLDLVRTGIG